MIIQIQVVDGSSHTFNTPIDYFSTLIRFRIERKSEVQCCQSMRFTCMNNLNKHQTSHVGTTAATQNDEIPLAVDECHWSFVSMGIDTRSSNV